jgi:hypothetical protein
LDCELPATVQRMSRTETSRLIFKMRIEVASMIPPCGKGSGNTKCVALWAVGGLTQVVTGEIKAG